jgi:PAS domain S-box-containing protein
MRTSAVGESAQGRLKTVTAARAPFPAAQREPRSDFLTALARRLVDSNIIGIVVWNLAGRILDANRAFLRMVGYSREDVARGNLRWSDITPAEWRDLDAQCLAELGATGTVQPIEKECTRKAGGRVSVLVGAASLDGTGDESVAFVLDVSHRKKAELAAREAERRYREAEAALARANRLATTGKLSASIAHELNQPIAGAVINAHTALRCLAAPSPDLPRARQALERILRDCERASETIERVRSLMKKAAPRKDRVDINEAIREVVALTHGDLAKKEICVREKLADTLPLVEGDRVELQQVILNLMLNAVEAMSDAGEGKRELIICTARPGPGEVLVAVEDSGPGMQESNLQRIFDAFYTTKADGLGLGLSICRSIVDAHGGRMWASRNVPRGAIFRFTLPVIPSSAHGSGEVVREDAARLQALTTSTLQSPCHGHPCL